MSMASVPAVTPAPEEAAFEIKGSVSSLTVLRLRTTDVARVRAELGERVTAFPQIFAHAPVVVDVGCVDASALEWPALVTALRGLKLVPVGVAQVPSAELERAAAAGLGQVQLGSRLRAVDPEGGPDTARTSEAPDTTRTSEAPDTARTSEAPDTARTSGAPDTARTSGAPDTARTSGAPDTAAREPVPAPAPAPAPVTTVVREPMIVEKAVRGGQVVYARGVDLVARAPVNAGAQVIADGNIYVWGPLRGRALAGAQGRKDARIYCLSLEAELVSVAGEYVLAEEIPDALRGKPAQIYLDGERVKILPA
jgi:septum site-determining protein MinC